MSMLVSRHSVPTLVGAWLPPRQGVGYAHERSRPGGDV